MTTWTTIFCVIGVGVVSAQLMKVILWLDDPRRGGKRTAESN